MILAVDTETTGSDFFNGCAAFAVGACDGEDVFIFRGEVNPYTRDVYWEEEELEALQQLLDKADKIVFHNTQFDMRALASIGIEIDHLWEKVEDTLLASHILASGDEHGLKYCSTKYLHRWNDEELELKAEIQSKRITAKTAGYAIAKEGHPHFPGLSGSTVKWWALDMWLAPEEMVKYLISDVESTWLLWNAFRVALTEHQHWKVYKLRKKLLKICFDITSRGMSINRAKAESYIENLELKIELIKKYLRKFTGIQQKFNWDKKGHLTTLIHDKLGIPVLYRTDSGLPSTAKDSINHYIEGNPSKQLRALQKGRLLDTKLRYVTSYLKWCGDGNRIHSNLNVTGTRETRQSSTGPNQQNITGVLKDLFEPDPGYVWVEIDFANIELRIWAYSIGNEDLIAAFESGKSVHMLIMEALYPKEAKRFVQNPKDPRLKDLYRRIKGGNFAIIYGATEKKADETYGYAGATAKVYSRFPGVAEYTSSRIRQCEQNMVDLQRHCIFTFGDYPLDVPTEEPFKACNYYIQGSAGIVMTEALIKITENQRYLDSDSQLISQVHDSTTPEIPIHPGMDKTLHRIIHSMETCVTDRFGPTPVDYDIKYNPADEGNPHLQALLDYPF